MTTIAWDGKTLAGDRPGDYQGTRVRVRKVYKVRIKNGPITGEALIGGAGDGALIAHWRGWLLGEQEKPVWTREASFTGIIVDRRCRVWQVEWNLIPMRRIQKQYAIGSGRGEAMAAMVCGATARLAVGIAARLECNTGMGVDTVSFK